MRDLKVDDFDERVEGFKKNHMAMLINITQYRGSLPSADAYERGKPWKKFKIINEYPRRFDHGWINLQGDDYKFGKSYSLDDLVKFAASIPVSRFEKGALHQAMRTPSYYKGLHRADWWEFAKTSTVNCVNWTYKISYALHCKDMDVKDFRNCKHWEKGMSRLDDIAAWSTAENLM